MYNGKQYKHFRVELPVKGGCDSVVSRAVVLQCENWGLIPSVCSHVSVPEQDTEPCIPLWILEYNYGLKDLLDSIE